MAKYLWVGSTAGSYVSNAGATAWISANLVDQYNFNKAGNWYTQVVSSGSYRWGATTGVPGNGDIVVIGGEYANSAQELLGWTSAKSPLIFGGFSGGVGSGSWSNTVGSPSGTTYTTPLNAITVNLNGGVTPSYTFPYLGGGITGDIATWCATRDGVSAGWHVKAYSSGVRDPQANLKLKWKSYHDARHWKMFIGSAPSDVSGISYTNTFIYDFEPIKAYTQIGATGTTGATGAGGIVQSILQWNGRGGAGLRVRNGSIGNVQLNPFYPTSVVEPIQNYRYSQYNDNGVEFYNTIVGSMNAYKWQSTYVKGCTLGVVWVYPVALGVGPITNNIATYYDQATFELASNIDATETYKDIYGGYTFSSTDIPASYNKLNLSFVSPTLNNNYSYDTVFLQSQQSTNRQTVVVGDRNTNIQVSIPAITIQSANVLGVTGTDLFGSFNYMPWGLEFAGPVVSTTITNNGGYLYSNADIDTDANLRLSEIYLGNGGILDFGKRKSGFDNWMIGGFCAASGQINGGIIFNDETGRVLGSEGVRLWNTQTKGFNTINSRLAGAPKSSAPDPNSII